MSGVYSEEDKLSGLWSHSFKDTNFINLIEDYKKFLETFLRRDAGTLMVQHKGGLDSFVMSSGDLTKKIQLNHPALKLINSLMTAQNSSYGSGGYYVGVLCLSLFKGFLLLEYHDGLSRRVIKDITEEIMSYILTFLECKPSDIVRKIDIGNVNDMRSYVKSFIDKKNLCLSNYELEHLATQLVRAFLESLDENNSNDCFGEVVIKVIEGRPTCEAAVIKGLLYKDNCPNIKLINAIKETSQRTQNSFNYLTMVLFNIPLSFEKTDTKILKYFGNVSNREMYNKIVIDLLLKIARQSKINIIACQKFIDEEIKYELERNKILVLERLGTSQTKAVQRLTGCFEISDITWLFDEKINLHDKKMIGMVTNINVMEIGMSSYLQILNECKTENKKIAPVVTLIFPVMISGMDENIQGMTDSCIKNLRLLALNPIVSASRGCLEGSIVSKVSQYRPPLDSLDVTEAEYSQVRNTMSKVFARLSVCLADGNGSPMLNFNLDSTSGHLINTSVEINPQSLNNEDSLCCCGRINLQKSDEVIPLLKYCEDNVQVIDKNDYKHSFVRCNSVSDNYNAKLNAIKSAFQLASQLYGVEYCIFDK